MEPKMDGLRTVAVETPRQRQVREVEQELKDGEYVAGLFTARQKRNQAKCKLVGHRPEVIGEVWATNATLYECARCGEAWEEESA